MAIRSILEAPDPRLRTISTPVETFDDDLRELVADMFETMYAAPGIGLAAIQVGVPKRVLVIDLQQPGPDQPDGSPGVPVPAPRVFINPAISDPSSDRHIYSEGCLSLPEIYADVERPRTVRVRWQDLDGAKHEEEVDELMATCLQHEMDHLNGVLFIDHLSRLKRDMALKKLEKLRKAA
jgi:peptide deformylase